MLTTMCAKWSFWQCLSHFCLFFPSILHSAVNIRYYEAWWWSGGGIVGGKKWNYTAAVLLGTEERFKDDCLVSTLKKVKIASVKWTCFERKNHPQQQRLSLPLLYWIMLPEWIHYLDFSRIVMGCLAESFPLIYLAFWLDKRYLGNIFRLDFFFFVCDLIVTVVHLHIDSWSAVLWVSHFEMHLCFK